MKFENERRMEMQIIMLLLIFVLFVTSILMIIARICTWLHTAAIDKYLKTMNAARRAEANAQLTALKNLIAAIRGVPEEISLS